MSKRKNPDEEKMRYPNLFAEFETGCCSLSTFAEHAHVEPPLMRAILRGDESISPDEARRLIRLLNGYGREVTFEYLFGDTLAMVNPHGGEGKKQSSEFQYMLGMARMAARRAGKIDWWDEGKLNEAESVAAKFKRGYAVPYARYRQALGGLARLIGMYGQERKPPRKLGEQNVDFVSFSEKTEKP